MDYIHLKKTLIAVFDHFLSCHDMNDLEQMMQAFEGGKKLVISLPEPISREDYADDIRRMNMGASEPKKTVSPIRKKKPKIQAIRDMQQIKICDVPVLLDLAKLSKEKQETLKDVLHGDHHIKLNDVKMSDMHGFATASIFKVVKRKKNIASCKMLRSTQHNSSLSRDLSEGRIPCKNENKISSSPDTYREKLIQNIMLEIKKYRDPP